MNTEQPISLTFHPSGNSWMIPLPSVQATESLGNMLGRELVGGEIIALLGELGAGKTVLVRGLASGIGINPTLVTSPTFTLIQEYHGRIPLIHADLYRIENSQELAHIGFDEYLESSSVVAIEWAARLGDETPDDRLEIHLEHQGRSVRTATLTPIGSRSHDLMAKIVKPFL